MPLDLSDQDVAVLADLLKRAIDDSRYPLSPRVTRWREILQRLRPRQNASRFLPRSTASRRGPSGGGELAQSSRDIRSRENNHRENAMRELILVALAAGRKRRSE
jgi:hypothetical protein